MLALLERIRRQDAGEIEPPEIAISGALPRGDEVGDWDEDAAEDGEDESEVVTSLQLTAHPMQAPAQTAGGWQWLTWRSENAKLGACVMPGLMGSCEGQNLLGVVAACML